MKKNELPQDKSFLEVMTREVCYCKGDDGKYGTELSTGWNVKHEALVEAWEDINKRIKSAKETVLKGEKSPVYYFMELNLMDVSILSAYTGLWKIKVKRHMNPKVFAKLNDKKLSIYAKVFNITVEELKNFKASDEN